MSVIVFEESSVNVAFTSCEPLILGTTNCPEKVVGVLAEADCGADMVEGVVVNELPPSVMVIVFAPSNPYLSIDPILSLSKIKTFLHTSSTPVIAVSPVVDGQAIKGPTTKIMTELGLKPSAVTIAKHYDGLIDGLILDVLDQSLVSQVEDMGIRTKVMNTVMHNDQDKIQLARGVLDFAQEIELGGE